MALKIAINGEKKSIAGRTSRPVVFINGEKKRLTKGVTFINGEKKYLWGTENKIEVFKFTSDTFNSGTPTPIYIDEKVLVLNGSASVSSTSKDYLSFVDISNTSSVKTINNYEWGSFSCYSPYDGETVKFSAVNVNTINQISYTPGESTALVTNAYTFTKPDSNTLSSVGAGARLNDGNYMIRYAKNISARPMTYNYYIYKNQSVVVSMGYDDAYFKQNCGNYILSTYGGSTERYSLYKLTGSGFGSAVYSDLENTTITYALEDGEFTIIKTSKTLRKLDNTYTVLWTYSYDERISNGAPKTLSSTFVGKGKDGFYYMLFVERNEDYSEYLKLRAINPDTGLMEQEYDFNYYDENGDLITNWFSSNFISDFNYLPLVYHPNYNGYEMFVARIFVG